MPSQGSRPAGQRKSKSTDGLTSESRVLFALFVRCCVGEDRVAVREAMGWTGDEENDRYDGRQPFGRKELARIEQLVVERPTRTTGLVVSGESLAEIRDDLADGEAGCARRLRELIGNGRRSAAPDGPAEVSGTGGDAAGRVMEMLLDPEQAHVVLPAAIFGVIVGPALLRHAKPFMDATSLAAPWLLVGGVVLWVIFCVVGFDRVVGKTFRKRLRKIWPLRGAYEALDTNVELAVPSPLDRTKSRLTWIGTLPDDLEDEVRLRLAKAETCERLVFWSLLAAALIGLTTLDTAWARWVFPLLLTLSAGVFLQAASDYVGQAAQVVGSPEPAGASPSVGPNGAGSSLQD